MVQQIVDRILDGARQARRKALLEPEAKEICRAYQMPTQEFLTAHNADEAVECSQKVTFPVVMKIISPDVLHKTDAGGVILNVNSKEEARSGYEHIISNVKAHDSNARILGVLVQHMAPKGVEVIVGGIRDAQFGPTILFGLGGIFVEVLKDVTFRVAPLSQLDEKEMVHGIRAYPILTGIRGQPASDEQAIMTILGAASRLMTEHETIGQLDFNPVIVYPTGASIVDARILLT